MAIRNAGVTGARTHAKDINDERAKVVNICGYNPWPGPSTVQTETDNRRIDAENRRSKALDAAARARMNPSITSCDAGGCWDTSGNRYNNAAGGNFIRQDGSFCTRSGPTLNCN